ncbi:MAG: hypothetical protein RH949_02065, partial [Coleofasciculus sp. A1-SPW-01]
KPIGFPTAIAYQRCRGNERVGQGGFCRKVIGFWVKFVPKPAPTNETRPNPNLKGDNKTDRILNRDRTPNM